MKYSLFSLSCILLSACSLGTEDTPVSITPTLSGSIIQQTSTPELANSGNIEQYIISGAIR